MRQTRLKILFISSWFPSKIRPTDGNFVQRHAEAVSTMHEVEVIHAVADPLQKEKLIMDEKSVNGVRIVTAYYPESKNSAKNFWNRMQTYRHLYHLAEKPDLVHANILHTTLFFVLWLKLKYKIPYVITEHFTDFRPINLHLLSGFRKWMVRSIGNKASYILPVTDDLRKGLRKIGVKTPMKVVPNVVNTATFSVADKMSRPFTFLHISNLVDRKNPVRIIENAKYLMKQGLNIRLKIGGDADHEDFEKVQTAIKNSGFENNFELFGSLDSSGVAQKMNESDCFILFSDDENQPCVITESFASGIPVISSNVGGISEFFPENFGTLIQVDDKELRDAMEKMANEGVKAEPNEMASYANEKFSVEQIAKEFSEIYHKVLHEDIR